MLSYTVASEGERGHPITDKDLQTQILTTKAQEDTGRVLQVNNKSEENYYYYYNCYHITTTVM